MWTCIDGICSWCKADCPASSHIMQCLSITAFTPCTNYIGSGLGLALLAALCNGSFSALAKCDRVRHAQVPPYIFNLWLCVGVCIASAPIAYGTAMRCASVQGGVSGLLFVLSTGASMQAIQLIGLSQAIGIGCGTAALVSFGWGLLIETGTVAQLPRALAGMAAILLGIAGVAAAGALQQAITSQQQQEEQQQGSRPQLGMAAAGADVQQLQQPLLADADAEQGTDPTVAAAAAAASRQQAAAQQQQQWRRIVVGLVLALATGVLGGLILAPMDYVGRECRGLPYQAAVAVGVAAAAVPVTYCLHWLQAGKVGASLPLHPLAAAVPGMLAGIIWAAGSASSMVAAATIGLAISYPIMQSGLFVAGLLGIVLYGELHSLKPHLVYWGSGVVLVLGIVLVSGAGRQQ
uniref:EamA domain-containing protein n=1 Tax=Tetradesmus obliquus TaxID=3088 RepID=A0A383V610_TETOB|eukprot:jgi/Sobl393_1/13654/SZX60370.1